jgi:hypothetical protein
VSGSVALGRADGVAEAGLRLAALVKERTACLENEKSAQRMK